MRYYKKRMLALMILLSVLCCSVPSIPVHARENLRSAKIYTITGEVHIRRGGDKELAAFEGMRLEQGDTLLTGNDSTAVIEIDSDKTVDVDENTEIIVDTLAGTEKKSQTGISVFFGNIVNSIRNKLTDGSSYDTRTSTAVMGVRGTTYLVSQPAGEANVMVSGGTVAVSQVSDGTSEMEEPVPVTKGNQYQCAADGQKHEAVPVDADSLMALTPGVAKALVTEELLGAVSDLPETFTTVEQLVGALSVRQEEIKQQTQQRIEEKAAAVEQHKEAEPAAFFEIQGSRLTGNNAAFLTSVPVSAGKDPAVESKTPESRSQTNTKEAGLPQTVSPEPAVSPEDGAKAKEESPVPNAGGAVSPSPAVPDQIAAGKPGSSSDKVSGGGSGDYSEDHNSGSGSRPGIDVELSEVTVEGLRQDRVYEQLENGGRSETVAGLAISWIKAGKANSYQLEIKKPGGEFTTVPEGSYIQRGVVCRYLYALEGEESMNGVVMRITPLTRKGITAVPASITLDFDSASDSLGLRKLPAPKISYVRFDNEESNVKVQFYSVNNAHLYNIAIYQDEELKENEDFFVPYEGNNKQSQYIVKEESLLGNVIIEMRSLGDGFDLWSSERSTFKMTAGVPLESMMMVQKEGTALNPPEAKITYEEESGIEISWQAVEHADGYLIEGRRGGEDFAITEDFQNRDTDPDTVYCLISEIDPEAIEMLRIRSLGDGVNYLDSNWQELDLSFDELQEIPALSPPIDDPLAEDVIHPGETDPDDGSDDKTESDETITDESVMDETIADESITDETIADESITDDIVSGEEESDGLEIDEVNNIDAKRRKIKSR